MECTMTIFNLVKRCTALSFLGSLGVASALYSQDRPAPPPARPATAPPVISPELLSDRRVTFRIRAPKADEVTVSGEWGGQPQTLTKDEQGVWSATIGPLAPEIYGYSFTVDGLRIADPGNPALKPMRSPTTSILEVPGQPPLLHEFQDVPHGTVRHHWYASRSLGVRRSLHVYTPPGYDKETQIQYPVLYLFHGSGDNDATWAVLGRAHLILDNLLAQGKVKPMVVVMTDGHAALPQVTGGVTPNMISRNVEDFGRDLLEDVVPFVESSYRVKKERTQRAIAGLSMGGGQSLTVGLNHLDLFAWVGGFSSFLRNPETTIAKVLTDSKGTNEKLKLLWIACGKDDRLIEQAQEMSALLKQKGIRHEFLATEGNHSWPVWRRYLADFAPLLFR
jgi:enterochelin esterase-like enzyme